ncbi:MAG: methyltransferase domain-containing protein [Bacteroidota bacterium]|nr:methyltransferase domain-containing protein [Bacteroidota bacterium]
MDIETFLDLIPQSQSDQLLTTWGFDLVREYFDVAQQLPPTNSPVIELATGTGRMCAILSCMFPSTISGDISLADLPRTLQRVPKQFLSNIQFLQLNMENLPFCSDSIISLVCMNTMHEVEHPQKCLQEMIRVMSPDGTLVVGDFNRAGFNAMQKIHEIVYHNDHHKGFISNNEIKKILVSSFHSVRSITTPLNITYFSSLKK